jgi:death-on-curing protein
MLIERFGGQHGVRDLGLIESALARPQSGYYETLAIQAAALLQSFTMNHGFVDGNKRIAFAITAVFLRLNGYRIVVPADDAETFLIDEVIKKKAGLEKIAEWLHEHWQPIS